MFPNNTYLEYIANYQNYLCWIVAMNLREEFMFYQVRELYLTTFWQISWKNVQSYNKRKLMTKSDYKRQKRL